MNLFIDMDGVIVKYNTDDYVARPDSVPLYLTKHYFENLEEDIRIVEYLNTLQNDSNDITFYILSRIPDARMCGPETFADIVESKMNWLKYHCTLNFDVKNIILTPYSKCEAAKRVLKRPLCSSDILVDDFNNNLIEWRAAGGVAFKYVNGLNSAETAPCLYFGFGSK